MKFLWALCATLLFATAAHAVNPDEILKDPALETRARALSTEIRCLVCQNQSIDNSDAELAKDLRKLVREQLKTGKTDTAIKDYLVARYGEFVLLRLPVRGGTYLLWFGPLVILLLGGIGIGIFLRRQNPRIITTTDPGLTAAEEKRVEALLREES